MPRGVRAALCIALALAAAPAAGEDAVTGGEVVIDPPTLICLGVYWPVSGDDDGDANVAVHFRRKGGKAWRRGMDLWRTHGETCGDRFTPPVWRTPNAFAGSLFDLEPDTPYEVRLTLTDPDGVRGRAVRTLTNAGEADGSVRNVRFLRNTCSFTCQPLWGGPVYFIRNLGHPRKYMQHPSGVVACHNRFGSLTARGGRHAYLNNIVEFSWHEWLFRVDVDSEPGRIDGNAYRLWRKGKPTRPSAWTLKTPSRDVTETTFDAFRRAAGVEAHGLAFESPHDKPLIDAALALPNVNDDYNGAAPDIGPYEKGSPKPHYGPRPPR